MSAWITVLAPSFLQLMFVKYLPRAQLGTDPAFMELRAWRKRHVRHMKGTVEWVCILIVGCVWCGRRKQSKSKKAAWKRWLRPEQNLEQEVGVSLVKSISGRRCDIGKKREQAGRCTRMCVAGIVWSRSREGPRHTCPRVRLRSQRASL